MNVTPAQMFG